jgi:hypothetical protein
MWIQTIGRKGFIYSNFYTTYLRNFEFNKLLETYEYLCLWCNVEQFPYFQEYNGMSQ